MGNRLMMIMTKDELGRIKLNDNLITVDLHGLTPGDAKRLVKNIMALDREGYDICTIHGYNHGTAIKRMISGSLSNPRLVSKERISGNLGRTRLKLQAV